MAASAYWLETPVYPPPADTTPMLTCSLCGTPTPPQCVGSTGICLDCHCGLMADVPSGWPESPLRTLCEQLQVRKFNRQHK